MRKREPDLRVVRTEPISYEQVVSEIRDGSYRSQADLVRRSGLKPQIIRDLVKNYAPANKIKLPGRSAPREVWATPTQLPETTSTGWVAYLIAAMIGAVGMVLGAAGLATNYQFASSLGQPTGNSHLFGTIGVAIDCGTILLPTVISMLWDKRHWGGAFWASGFWMLCLGLSLIAGMSFSANNIGDTLQGRETVVQNRKAFSSELRAVQIERGKITEDRDPQVLEQSIQIERSKVPLDRLKSSKDCTDVTTSGQFCNELNQLRASKRTSERRIELDGRIRDLTDRIAALPPIAVKDPGADHIARLTGIEPDEVENFRVIGFAVLPTLAGFLLAFARTLFK